MLSKVKQNWMKVLMMLCVLTLSVGFFQTESQAAPKLNKKKITISVGDKVKLQVKGTGKKVKWSSSKKAVCKVSKKGVVTGKKAGTAQIKAKVGKKTLKCKVKVKANAQQQIARATGLTLTGNSTVLAKGGTMQLTLGYLPANAIQEEVKWYTSSDYRATVENGLVTAKNNGEVTITAYLATNEDIKATYKITIKDITADIKSLGSEDGGDLITTVADSKQAITFTMSDTVPDVQVHVTDGVGNIVRTYPMGTVGPTNPVTCTWDLSNSSGAKVADGGYRFTITAVGATINSDIFNVYSYSEFGSGNGSPTSPYPVSNLEQLAMVAKHNGACFVQTADIDANLTAIAPMFTSDVPFSGTYDGGGHSIKNVSNMTETNETAIFRAVGTEGVIRNLTVAGSFFSGASKIAALVGVNSGTLDTCKVIKCSVTATAGDAGMLAGQNYGTIKNCISDGNTISDTCENVSVGGICGYNKGSITSCMSASNNITESGYGGKAGGIAGYNDGTIVSCTIKSSEIKAENTRGNAGGVTGYNKGSVGTCDVTECTISGWYQGGIIGYNKGNYPNNTYSGSLNQVGSN